MVKVEALISERFSQSIELKKQVLSDPIAIAAVESFAREMAETLERGACVFFAGNGGSAADSQHLAAELVSKFYIERQGFSSEALTVNTSIMTAIGNDYSFERIFARQLEARAKPGDLFVGISTSGNSANIVAAFETARRMGLRCVGMTGEGGGKIASLCDVLVAVPSLDTPRVQEIHILVGHIACEYAEKRMCSRKESL